MASLSARIDTGNGPADVAPAEGWQLAWIDQRRAIARLTDGQQSLTVLVEGAGTQWFVTIRGRRVPVSVQSWRERVLADAEAAGAEGGGPVEVRAILAGKGDRAQRVAGDVHRGVQPGHPALAVQLRATAGKQPPAADHRDQQQCQQGQQDGAQDAPATCRHGRGALGFPVLSAGRTRQRYRHTA